MVEYIVVAASSFILSLMLTPVARRVARTVHLVDRPDGRRKLHGQVVAVAGGVPLLLAVTIPLAVYLFGWADPLDPSAQASMLGLLLGSMLICLVGTLDDLGRLRG